MQAVMQTIPVSDLRFHQADVLDRLQERPVVLTRQARRDLERLPERIQGWAMQTIDSLAVNPRPPSWKRLQGGLGYSIRHGDYRLVYDIIAP